MIHFGGKDANQTTTLSSFGEDNYGIQSIQNLQKVGVAHCPNNMRQIKNLSLNNEYSLFIKPSKYYSYIINRYL